MNLAGRDVARVGRREFLAAGLAFGAVVAGADLLGSPALAALPAGSADGAGHFISDLASEAIATMGDGAATDAQRIQRFHDLFVASFDLPAIGQIVLGRHWETASPAQQAHFLELFERQEALVWAARFERLEGRGADGRVNRSRGRRMLERAHDLARRSIQLGPDLSVAHAQLARL